MNFQAAAIAIERQAGMIKEIMTYKPDISWGEGIAGDKQQENDSYPNSSYIWIGNDCRRHATAVEHGTAVTALPRK
jgi:hypothetical protein